MQTGTAAGLRNQVFLGSSPSRVTRIALKSFEKVKLYI